MRATRERGFTYGTAQRGKRRDRGLFGGHALGGQKGRKGERNVRKTTLKSGTEARESGNERWTKAFDL